MIEMTETPTVASAETARPHVSGVAPCYVLYTMQRARKDDSLYGPVHGSTDGDITACGISTDHNWHITNNRFDGVITCQKCCINIRGKLYHELPHSDT